MEKRLREIINDIAEEKGVSPGQLIKWAIEMLGGKPEQEP